MRVKVSRRRWGTGKLGGYLLAGPEDGPGAGKMCCLGFACRQIGLSASAIKSHTMPVDLVKHDDLLIKKGLCVRSEDGYLRNSTLAARAAEINDQDGLTRREREQKLRKLFKAHGHTIVFVP